MPRLAVISCWRDGNGSTGAPDRIRTYDLCLRRAALYPAELRVLEVIVIDDGRAYITERHLRINAKLVLREP